MARNNIRLGDLLVKANKITRVQLSEILELQKEKHKKIGELIVDEGLLTEREIIDVLQQQLGIDKVEIMDVDIDYSAINLVNESLCRKYELFPFSVEDGAISIAIADPLNIFAVDDVAISTGLRVVTYIATKREINDAIDRFYSNRNMEDAVEEISKARASSVKRYEEISTMDDVKNAPIVKLVDSLIKNAIEQRASDIHIEPYENYIRVRYRIDGHLKEISKLNIEVLPALITRIKILASLNITEKRVPQDGRIVTLLNGRTVDMRISIIPLVSGEKVVIRILDRSNFKVGKQHLGMSPENLKKLEDIIASPNGIILITGPTGSGKSTTLYSILNELNDSKKNIITVEDPVEYSMDGINQVNVNPGVGLTFASGLRSILRQDPDVIMIGEMRDAETAEIGIRAAITGHLVLSTLHTNDAPSSIMRLVDMGIEPFLVSTSLKGIVAQRLVRKVCDGCGYEYEADIAEKRILGIDPNETVMLKKGQGCAKCGGSGYAGRMGVYEIMNVDREIKDAILTTNNTEVIKDIAIKNGMKTLKDNCRELVLNGSTTTEEMMKIIFMSDL